MGCHRCISREQRKCNWWESDLRDELYFVMNCLNFISSRKQLIKRHHTIRPSAFTFDKLMNIVDFVIFAKRTISPIQESCENYYSNSVTKEKWEFVNSKFCEKSQNLEFAKI